MDALDQLQITLPENFLCEEVRCGYKVTKEIKELWAVELDLLAEFDRVCTQHNIRYTLIAGSILGAVRHQGFIPWDDDIDVALERKEYERLCAIGAKAFRHPYFFQTEQTDPGSTRGHAQLRNSNTTEVLANEKGRFRFNQGIFMDIFPMDEIPDDSDLRKDFYDNLRTLRDRAVEHAWQTTRLMPQDVTGLRRWKRKLKRFVSRKWHWFSNKDYQAYELAMQQYNGTNTEEISTLPVDLVLGTTHWKREWFTDTKRVPYEMLMVPIPVAAEEILTATYGNWNEYVVGTSMHGGLLWDAHTPYQQSVFRYEAEALAEKNKEA